MWRVSVLAVLAVATCVVAVPRDQLYPFGSAQGDNRLPTDDDLSSEEIKLRTPMVFYDEQFWSIYVNLNGHLTFETELAPYQPNLVLPIGYKTIAVFFADVDTTLSGNVYYRETQDPSLLDKASGEIRQHFARWRDFQPTSLFIVTWDEVGYYSQQYDRTNSFQVVIATDGRDTFVFYLYADGGINWVTSDGKQSPLTQDPPAQAGFDAGDGRRVYRLPGSGEFQVENLSGWSNVDTPGRWMFRVGNLRGGNIEEPRKRTDPDGGNDVTPKTCDGGGSQNCHANAICRDFAPKGFCCRCQPGFFGDGKKCITKGEPQRVNGKVTGTLNGHVFDNVDLHAYILPGDGRTYVAVGRVPQSIGYAMQSLYSIAGGLGWLFANSTQPRAKNGFMITGGEFNRTATVTYTATGESVNIRQVATQDAAGYMRMSTVLNGNIPNVAAGARVEVEDFSEEYRRTAKGNIASFSRYTYLVDGVPYSFSVDQNIIYKECEADPLDQMPPLKLIISRSYVVYQEEEELVRYSMANKMSVAGADPCRDSTVQCDVNANCVPLGTSVKCTCKQGFHGDGFRCLDIDECAMNLHDCDSNARCTNTDGSYQCTCAPGFIGDGKYCYRDQSCGDSVCAGNAQCVYDPELFTSRCVCNSGYAGDGTYCEPVEFGCNEVNNCDENAVCVYDEYEQRYVCECEDGFSGDGYSCTDTGEQDSCDIANNCDVDATCLFDPNYGKYRCICNEGFSGDGYRCVEESCDVAQDCHYDAQCVYDSNQQRHACVCNTGFYGDGYQCSQEGCDVVDNCDRNAQCVYDPRIGRYACKCNQGYEGDGLRCREEVIQCNQVNNCDINADCIPDRETGTYVCRCRSGYSGDGYSCRLTANCRRDPRICDVNAQCQQRGTDYICVCMPGYTGDGRRCAPEGEGESFLMYAQGMAIMSVPFSPTDDNKGKQVLYIPGQTAIGLGVDCYSRYFYWTDVSGKMISRARLDGIDSEPLVRGLGSPEGIAIDWVGRNMYWTDSGLDRIEVSRLDGSNRKTLFDTDLVNPRGIVVDPARGFVFWTDWNRDAPKIERANMDGTDRMTLVSENLGLPNGLTIDYTTERICWADAGTMHIECINYHGTGNQVIYSLASYPFDIALAGDLFYWTDWDMKSLPNIQKYGGVPNDPLTLPHGGNGRLYGLMAVPSTCPRGSNACVLNNGGCRFLCLPTPNGGRTCACPDDIDPEECNRIALIK